MMSLIEKLYYDWIGSPSPDKWPAFLEDKPLEAHGLYCFDRGLRLGFQLATEAFHADMEL